MRRLQRCATYPYILAVEGKRIHKSNKINNNQYGKHKFREGYKYNSAIPYFDEPYVVQMTKDKLDRFVFPHPDNEVDLCAIFIQKELHDLYIAPKPYYMCALSKSDLMTKDAAKSLPGICDVIMVGYPNGLWDSKHNMPIYRKGITATWPCLDYNGKRQFVIDCACFGGSSGSPVFYTNTHTLQGYENPKLIGVLYAGSVVNSVGEIVVETGAKVLPNAHTRNMMNLGFVVFADCVSELEGIVRNSLKL